MRARAPAGGFPGFLIRRITSTSPLMAGRGGLRCLVSYRALAHLAYLCREGRPGAADPVVYG